MHRHPRAALSITFAALLLGTPLRSLSAQRAEPLQLDEATFAELHAALTAAPAEAWESVPWRIDLVVAQHEAAAEKKPLFLWAMDGHPLACT